MAVLSSPRLCAARMSFVLLILVSFVALTVPVPIQPVVAAEPLQADLATEYAQSIRPLLQKYCVRCHGNRRQEAEINLATFTSVAKFQKHLPVWQKVRAMLESHQMPPPEARQPTEKEKSLLQQWVRRYLRSEANKVAGDPGPVLLRRLNNAELTWTIRDLTGADLSPARNLPVDGAAGEGFTNTGNALSMSPALFAKYLDVARDISRHAVVLPNGIRFSSSPKRGDWIKAIINEIRYIYDQYTSGNSDVSSLDRWTVRDPKQVTLGDGRVNLKRYFTALIRHRNQLKDEKALVSIARDEKLNAKYLLKIAAMLTSRSLTSPLLKSIQAQWEKATVKDAGAIVAEIEQWQRQLWKFNTVGHFGSIRPWQEPLAPSLAARQGRHPIKAAAGTVTTFYLSTGDVGRSAPGAKAIWRNPRLEGKGQPSVPLRSAGAYASRLIQKRQEALASTTKYLSVLSALKPDTKPDARELAKRHGLDPEVLRGWLDYLQLSADPSRHLSLFRKTMNKAGNYDVVKGWGTSATPSVVANSSDRQVRIPGIARPHSVVVHPSPTLYVAVGWKSPVSGAVRIETKLSDAHPECGNGFSWILQLQRGPSRQQLATMSHSRGQGSGVKVIPSIQVQKGDLLSLLVGPRAGNHACDLTAVDLKISEVKPSGREWDLAMDVSSDILKSNPHEDKYKNKEVWHFYHKPIGKEKSPSVPLGSLLSKWQVEPANRDRIANQLQRLLTGPAPTKAGDPDTILYRKLTSLSSPLLSRVAIPDSKDLPGSEYGLDPSIFTKEGDLSVAIPSMIAVKLPTEMVAGRQLVVTMDLLRNGRSASAQMQVHSEKPNNSSLVPGGAILSTEPKLWHQAFDDFRQLFPVALCYPRIVPVDEVVTLVLYHREDEPLCRLMLTRAEKGHLDRLWDELLYISRAPLQILNGYEQLMEFATQDSDPRKFEPLRKPIQESAAQFRKWQKQIEPVHVESALRLAARAYRRPLTGSEALGLKGLYSRLRKQDVAHEKAIRLLLTKVFASPAFLYRLEKPSMGAEAAPVSSREMATRLGYFLTSSLPDERLTRLAAEGKLQQEAILAAEAERLLSQPTARRLAIEFFCQWLQIKDFDQHDEKSEKHFPEFHMLRKGMYEESVLFLTDLIQNNRSILSVLGSDHTFLNEALAKHYQIPGVQGDRWRKVNGIGKHRRGGLLGQATVLAKFSGASRTSPVLRGNWVSEVLLGEKLPRPPKDVPRLPEEESTVKGMTLRQLVEKHSSDPACAKCHRRIDPYGFALERFDAIGRLREKDSSGLTLDVASRLRDGTRIQGAQGLREYLLKVRRDAFVYQLCKKLLGYALGRSVRLSDEPLLEGMAQALAKDNYRFGTAVRMIILSRQFREIRGQATTSKKESGS